jgi:surfeit locus 1 family protein
MRRILFALIIGLGGAAILISLGIWQVQRLSWKQGLLSEIEAKIDGAPMALQAAVEPEFQRYAPVALAGTFNDGHLRVLASRKTTGAVYRIVRPFAAEGYGVILLDTGWIRDGTETPAKPTGRIEMIGNLDAPNEIDSFTPEPDLGRNIWFARDVTAMSRALNTEPVLVVLRETPASDIGVKPWPVDTAGIPNDHLQYAITWFSLSAIWLAMSAYFLRRRRTDAVKD